MKNFLKVALLLGLAVAIGYPLSAQEKKAGKKGGGNPSLGQVEGLLKKAADADLSEEQSKKLKDAAEVARAKIKTASEKVGPEVNRQLAEARKKASGEGKKGKELKEAVEAAVKLTDEQKKGLAEIEAALADFRKAASEILSAEQREKIGLKGGKKK